MEDISDPGDAQDAAVATGGPATLKIDSTRASVLHVLYSKLGSSCRVEKLYAIAVAVTFVPLVVAALLGPTAIPSPDATLKLPFIQDWNVLFEFLVSFPCIVIMAATDQQVMMHSLHRVQLYGTMTVTASRRKQLSKRWNKRFLITNVLAQAVAIAAGGTVAYFNYRVYTPPDVGYWIAIDGRLLPAGYIFLYCVFLMFAVIAFYVCRSIITYFLLKDIVAQARLRPLPLHPDKSGGLRPMGELGLRNQYILMLIGINIMLLATVSIIYLDIPSSLYGLIVAAAVAYLVLGPVVFLGPLLPFRHGMLQAKDKLMVGLRMELQRLRTILESEPLTKEDEELIDRLRMADDVIAELPVWPFDAATLRKFLIAYGVPMLTSIGYPLVKSLFDLLTIHLP